MNVKIPPFLKSGDIVAIAATARWISHDQLQPALDVFHDWGLKTKLAENIFTHDYQLAGSDAERIKGFQACIDDPEVKAVIVARGGYGTVRVVDALDFSGFMERPKWICGYSDITVLHTFLNAHAISTIHSTMPISFPDATPEALQSLRECLMGELSKISFIAPVCSQIDPFQVSGRLLGGNLSVLYSQLGSVHLESEEPIILFLEDVDEMYYHIDRMMMGLKRAGWLRHVKALCIGGLTQMKDNTAAFGFTIENPWGATAEQTMLKFGNMLGIPVITGFPAGHQSDNRAFFLGRHVLVTYDGGRAVVQFQHE